MRFLTAAKLLPQDMRVALAVACVVRAYPVYEASWKSYFPPFISRAVRLLTDARRGGLSTDQVAAVRQEVDAQVDAYIGRGNLVENAFCVLLKRALGVVAPTGGDASRESTFSLVRTLLVYLHLVELCAHEISSHEGTIRYCTEIEEDWIEASLAELSRARSAGDFRDVQPGPPEWVRHWFSVVAPKKRGAYLENSFQAV